MELLQQLTHLPLAIVQAAAYINANDITLSEYLSLVGEADSTLVELLSENFEDDGCYAEAKNPIALTWPISFGHIQRSDPLAAEHLSFMAFVEPKMIPLLLLPAAQSRKKFADAVGTLTAYSFVTKRPDGRYCDLHRLVHVATRNWLANEGLLARWNGEALAQLARVFPDEDLANVGTWRAYLPHARRALAERAVKEYDASTLLLLGRFGECLWHDGRYAEAEASLLKLVKARFSLLGQEHPDTLSSMAQVAATYWAQGRYAEGEQLVVQVLEISKRVLGQEHPETLRSMSLLAKTYWNQRRLTEAALHGTQALELSKKVLGSEHPDTLMSMSNLALTYRDQRRLAEAEALGVQVLAIRQRLLGPEHPLTLTIMSNKISPGYIGASSGGRRPR